MPMHKITPKESIHTEGACAVCGGLIFDVHTRGWAIHTVTIGKNGGASWELDDFDADGSEEDQWFCVACAKTEEESHRKQDGGVSL